MKRTGNSAGRLWQLVIGRGGLLLALLNPSPALVDEPQVREREVIFKFVLKGRPEEVTLADEFDAQIRIVGQGEAYQGAIGLTRCDAIPRLCGARTLLAPGNYRAKLLLAGHAGDGVRFAVPTAQPVRLPIEPARLIVRVVDAGQRTEVNPTGLVVRVIDDQNQLRQEVPARNPVPIEPLTPGTYNIECSLAGTTQRQPTHLAPGARQEVAMLIDRPLATLRIRWSYPNSELFPNLWKPASYAMLLNDKYPPNAVVPRIEGDFEKALEPGRYQLYYFQDDISFQGESIELAEWQDKEIIISSLLSGITLRAIDRQTNEVISYPMVRWILEPSGTKFNDITENIGGGEVKSTLPPGSYKVIARMEDQNVFQEVRILPGQNSMVTAIFDLSPR